MNLVRRNPSNSLNHILDDFFNWSISDIVGTQSVLTEPAVNIIEEDDKYLLELAAPGLDKSDFNLEIEKNRLAISANIQVKQENQRTQHGEENQENNVTKAHRREFYFGSFNRSFGLPESVDKENISANYRDGVLSVVINKKPEAVAPKPRTIEIS